jgi:hypothetical protein
LPGPLVVRAPPRRPRPTARRSDGAEVRPGDVVAFPARGRSTGIAGRIDRRPAVPWPDPGGVGELLAGVIVGRSVRRGRHPRDRAIAEDRGLSRGSSTDRRPARARRIPVRVRAKT